MFFTVIGTFFMYLTIIKREKYPLPYTKPMQDEKRIHGAINKTIVIFGTTLTI